MRTILLAQLNPVKDMTQLIQDRSLYRMLILGCFLVAYCL